MRVSSGEFLEAEQFSPRFLTRGASVFRLCPYTDAPLFVPFLSSESAFSLHLLATRPFQAASKGRVLIAKQLVAAGAKLRAKDKTGATPLHRAAACGKPDVIGLLLDAEAQGASAAVVVTAAATSGPRKGAVPLIEMTDGTGATPLLVAAASQQIQAALLLVERGADVDAADKEGTTVLAAAGSALRPTLLEAAGRPVGPAEV